MKIEFKNPLFGKRLEALMNDAGFDVNKKGASSQLAEKMLQEKCLEFLVNNDLKKRKDSARSRIDIHRSLDSAENVEGKWLKAYCDYFKCSADYLFGYIDMPTHQQTDIEKVTGLSKAAINSLIGQKELYELFGMQNDKIDIINLILLDKHKKTSLSSALDLITGFCRFNISSAENKAYTVDQRGITPFQGHKTISGKGFSYNPMQAHFHLEDMESMYYLKIWDSIKELKEMYNESKTPDTN